MLSLHLLSHKTLTISWCFKGAFHGMVPFPTLGSRSSDFGVPMSFSVITWKQHGHYFCPVLATTIVLLMIRSMHKRNPKRENNALFILWIHTVGSKQPSCQNKCWQCTIAQQKLSWSLLVKWCHAYKCWDTIMNCGHWLGSRPGTSSTSQYDSSVISMSCERDMAYFI